MQKLFKSSKVRGMDILNILNSWATSYRNLRALSAAAMLLVAIVTMSLQRCNPMVGKVQVTGIVLTVEADGLQPHGSGGLQSRVVVSTPDSLKVRMFMPPPVPAVGDAIPLFEEQYENGDKLYYLDLQRWRIQGPGKLEASADGCVPFVKCLLGDTLGYQNNVLPS